MEHFVKAVWVLAVWVLLAALCVTMAGGVLAVEEADASAGEVVASTLMEPGITVAEEELVVRSIAYVCRGHKHLAGSRGAKPEATYAARAGVAATILNRMKDPRFPNSASLVIASDPVFSDVALTADLTERELLLSKAALDGAKNGFDPTEGALYFSPPGSPSSEYNVTCVFGGYSFGVP